ncbi:MAG TPA: methylmalonyl-CoA mutase family protein [Microvirga sp.]|jgi:methylmalonyl-CoA mutase|nr:methylmalonyl-CoA mutase family protein [Microvirga sp.]
MDDLPLAAEFPAATRERWLALVEGVLKGADFEKRLVSRTHEGIRIEPLYPKAEGAEPILRTDRAPWRVSQRVDHPDPEQAAALALADLEGGADALALVLAKAPAARGFGLRAETVDDLDRALQGTMLDLVHLRLDAGGRGRQAAAMLVALAERREHRLADLQIDLGLDPLGAMAAMGLLSASWDVVAARCADTLAGLAERGFQGHAFLADGRPYHEAGAGEAQELAAVLATGAAYLRALEAGGHPLDAARRSLSFLLVADADEFLTVAKFRALRRLWARVEAACGLDPVPVRLHAETAWRMTTQRDPWVNLLRTTLAAFSAGIGGADAVTVLPFTAALGLPDAFARRLARNTQHVLLEEANLWRVTDPAAGSGAFEALTNALCERAWSGFQEIEREGGLVGSLRGGALQARIAAVRDARERAVATRRDPITGTSEFPHIREEPISVLMPFPAGAAVSGAGAPPSPPAGAAMVVPFSSLIEAAAGGASLRDLAAGASGVEPVAIAALPSRRVAEPFERLRDAADAHRDAAGERPRVFLANLGPVASFTARATFAKNFYEAAGIEAVSGDGCSNMDELRQAYRKANAKLACICSSDEVYQEHAVEALRVLHEEGASRIHLAGRPRDLEQELGRLGISAFIFIGCDTLRVLAEALEAARA